MTGPLGRPWGHPDPMTTRASGAHLSRQTSATADAADFADLSERGSTALPTRPPRLALTEQPAVVVTSAPLRLSDITDVARHRARVDIDDEVHATVAAAHQVVVETVRSGSAAYGLNTGLGSARDQVVPEELLLAFQEQIISSHAAAIGAPLDVEEVRALVFARLAGISRGGSGASPQLFGALQALLNAAIHPVVPSQGSVGSADLVQMAAVGAVLLGKGRVLGEDGVARPAAQALAEAGIAPVQLQPKDALALIGANSASVGTGALAIRSIGHLLSNADVVAAHTVRALDANTAVFDDDLVRARPLPGQISSAARIRAALAGAAGYGSVRSVQDPISVRTVPQVHGVAIDQLEHVAAMLKVELNSRSENPLVRLEDRRVISNGNFSLLGVAVGFEGLRLTLAHVGMLAERRIALLARTLRAHAPVAEHIRAQRWRSDYLVPVLLANTAAAIVAELKQLASPLTVMGTPVADGVEDHNSLAFGAIQLTVTAAGWVQTLQALELLLASDLVLQRSPAAGVPVTDSGQLVAAVLVQLPAGATTDLVVERLRSQLVDTCLVADCLADQVVAADMTRTGVLSM